MDENGMGPGPAGSMGGNALMGSPGAGAAPAPAGAGSPSAVRGAPANPMAQYAKLRQAEQMLDLTQKGLNALAELGDTVTPEDSRENLMAKLKCECTCLNCEKKFITSRNIGETRRKFCSTSCRQKYAYKKERRLIEKARSAGLV